jgi:ATP-dependent exoDNAse (exonuclease V) beta subunit
MVDHLLMPEEAENREDREERRVTYVGLSRAENKLYICVEKLARDEEVRIKDLGLIIRRLSKSADDD